MSLQCPHGVEELEHPINGGFEYVNGNTRWDAHNPFSALSHFLVWGWKHPMWSHSNASIPNVIHKIPLTNF